MTIEILESTIETLRKKISALKKFNNDFCLMCEHEKICSQGCMRKRILDGIVNE